MKFERPRPRPSPVTRPLHSQRTFPPIPANCNERSIRAAESRSGEADRGYPLYALPAVIMAWKFSALASERDTPVPRMKPPLYAVPSRRSFT